MPWDDQTFRTIAVELFGGLVAEEDPADLPEGASPLCRDVEFEPGSVFQRRGLASVYPAIPGNPTIKYVRTYKVQDGQGVFTLLLDSVGNLWQEDTVNTPLTLTNITSSIVPGSYAFSDTYLAREYIAFHNGDYGVDIPRQYDGTNLDRVSQCGPGAAPSVMDESNQFTILASPNGTVQVAAATISTATEIGNICTITLTAPGTAAGLQVSDTVKIAGVGVGGYNGTFPLLSISPDGRTVTFFNPTTGLAASSGGTLTQSLYQIKLTAAPNIIWSGQNQIIPPQYTLQATLAGVGVAGYNGTWSIRAGAIGSSFVIVNIPNQFSLANSGNGTLTILGNVTAGIHQLVVMFLTRQGYLTQPSPIATWTAAGGKRVILTNIPTGPPNTNIVARVIGFTAAGGSNFFTIGPGAVIPGVTGIWQSVGIIYDNTTTSATFDFTDNLLLSETAIDQPGNNLFALVELGECLGVTQYALRTVWWGERNKLENVINFTFDGGFGPVGGTPTYPLGWTPVTGDGNSALTLGLPAVWGDAYAIQGNGNAIVGMIYQNVYQDSNNVPIVPANAPISVRVRLARNSSLVAGNIHIALATVPNTAFVIGTPLSVPASSLTTNYVEFIAQLTPSLTTVPTNLILLIYADGTPTTGGTFLVDCVELFPTAVPFNDSQLRLSYVQNPESFDGVTGIIQVSPGDGQQIRSCFTLRNILYVAKDRSLYAIQDNGSTEPSGWSVSEISATIGTCSVTGVAYPKGTEEGGEDWAVLASKKGAYLFAGGEMMKMSQEIQNDLQSVPTAAWDNINWAKANTLWCVNDSRARQIFVGAPTTGNNTPTTVIMIDYKELNTGYMVAAEGPIHTSYSGRVISWEPGRKSTSWSMAINAAALIDRPNGQAALFLGNNSANGKVYQLSATQFTDDGALIPSLYTTYAMPSREQERDYQLWHNRKFYYLLTTYLQGNGMVALNTFPANLANPGPSYTIPTVPNPKGDTECRLHVAGERCFFQIQSVVSGQWWKLRTLAVRMRPHAVQRIRQVNAI